MRILNLLASVALPVVLSACGTTTPGREAATSAQDAPVVTGEPAGYNAADEAFANGMLALDQQGVEIAALVATRSTNPDLGALASKSAAARQSDMAILRPLHVQWVENSDTRSGDSEPVTTPSGALDKTALAPLETLHARAFDVSWLQSSIKIDQAAIDLGQSEVAHGKNVDAIGIAKTLIVSRQAEIDQMKHMLDN